MKLTEEEFATAKREYLAAKLQEVAPFLAIPVIGMTLYKLKKMFGY